MSASRAEPLHSAPHVKPIVLFVATKWELAAVRRALLVDRQEQISGVRCFIGERRGRPYWLIRTGIGPKAAMATANAVLSARSVALAISAGFAGALVPAAIGDLIIGEKVTSASYNNTWMVDTRSVMCDCTLRIVAQSVAAELKMTARIGPVVSTSAVVCRAGDKQALSRASGASGLDMESAALASVAHERAVPFMVLRTVSDLVGEDLPLDFNLFLTPGGWLRGIQELLRRPSNLVGLNRLRRQSGLAARGLTAICAALAETEFGLSPAG
ncbi:MAG TPA: hypothetical protein VIR79_06365 [Nitrospira sp.]